MPVTTRSQSKKQKELVTSSVETTSDNSIETTSDNTSNYIYKDIITNIEFATETQCKMRGIPFHKERYNHENSNSWITIYGGYYYYMRITEIHPRYLNQLPDNLRGMSDLCAIAPTGFVWKEDDRVTSYYHWSEWYNLVKDFVIK
jgi:hypothetical protein